MTIFVNIYKNIIKAKILFNTRLLIHTLFCSEGPLMVDEMRE